MDSLGWLEWGNLSGDGGGTAVKRIAGEKMGE